MSDGETVTVTRSVDLDATVDEVWTALTDDRERADWFGGGGAIDVRPGGTGHVVEPDGSRRDVRVDAVEIGRRLRWRWGPAGEGDTSEVEFVIEAQPRSTRLTVTERRLDGVTASLAGSVTGRLLDLELLLLTRILV